MNSYLMSEVTRQRVSELGLVGRASELGHIAEQEYMYARIEARALRAARRIARRRALRARVAELAHLRFARRQPTPATESTAEERPAA